MGANLQVGPHARCVDLRPCAAGCGGAGRWLAARGAAAARRRAGCAAAGGSIWLGAACALPCPRRHPSSAHPFLPLFPTAPSPSHHHLKFTRRCLSPSRPPPHVTGTSSTSTDACRNFRGGDAVARAKFKLNVGPIL